jgi:hypothetical protein
VRVFFLFFCNITDTKILLLSLPQAKEKRSDTRASRADPDESVGNNNNDEFGVEWNASSAKGEKDNKDSDDEDDGDERTNTATGEGNNKKKSDGKKKKTTPRKEKKKNLGNAGKEKKKNLKKTPDSTKTESPVIGSYERNVIEKRKRNQERIKELGLEDATKKMKPAANKKKKNTKKKTKAPPTRKQASRKAKRGGEYDDESEKVEEHQKKNGGNNNEAGQKKDKDGGNNNKKASKSSSHCIISDDNSGTDNSKVTAVTTPLIQKKTRCNKDCKVTDESPITYSCDGCDDTFHWNCLGHEFNDIDRCHSCAKGNALFSEPLVSVVEEKKGDSETIAETDDLEAEVDYSKHYIVDCFLRHELEKKDKKNKNKRRRMMLLTHWKGWESKFDTLEPIEEKAEEEEALVLDYVKKHGDDILLNYIGNNENLFSQSFLAEVRALQKS